MKLISTIIEAHIFKIIEGKPVFLALKRAENERVYPGLWQPVTGKVNKNEKGYRAAIREVREETGLIPENFWVVPTVNSYYSYRGDFVNMIPVFAAQVKRDSNVVLCDEHCDYKWVNPEEAKRIYAWDGQKHSVEIITGYLTNQKEYFNFMKIKI